MKAYEVINILLKEIDELAVVGAIPVEIDNHVEKRIKELGATSDIKGYKPDWAPVPYPSVISVNPNDVIAHGIPNDIPFKDGDVVGFDLGINFEGQCADAGFTKMIGEPRNKKDLKLIQAAKSTLYAGIKVVRPGATNLQIGQAMQEKAKSLNFVTNRTLWGHGIGEIMHGHPKIPAFNFMRVKGPKASVETLEEGMVICIEPFLSAKDYVGKKDADGWTIKTRDKKKSAFFEHMVLVTKDGYKILTDHFNEK